MIGRVSIELSTLHWRKRLTASRRYSAALSVNARASMEIECEAQQLTSTEDALEGVHTLVVVD